MSDDPEVFDPTIEEDIELFTMGPASLKYFGADFDVEGLVKKLERDDIVIPRFDPDNSPGTEIEGFQRQFVWDRKRMDQFIETLLLGWPVPSIFMVRENDGRYLVLDGQQRLTTLLHFYKGQYPEPQNGEFALRYVGNEYKGVTIHTLDNDAKRHLNNTFIQGVVIEPQGESGYDSIYQLFGRLNSGGVSLSPQEIRVVLYRGEMTNLIRDLNQNESWRTLYGPRSKNLKDHELILRAFAMQDTLLKASGLWEEVESINSIYQPPMSQYLNHFLEKTKTITLPEIATARESFENAFKLLDNATGGNPLRLNGRLNAAHVDSVLGVVSYAISKGEKVTQQTIARGLESLTEDQEYMLYVTKSTSHRESVIGRLRLAHLHLVGE